MKAKPASSLQYTNAATTVSIPAAALQQLASSAPVLQALHATDEQPVPSPCVNVCKLFAEPTADMTERMCMGCLRTVAEIKEWRDCSAERKRAIWRQIIGRMQTIEQHERGI